jgi:pimeloyl-ACP methyl ester carboxylesterase
MNNYFNNKQLAYQFRPGKGTPIVFLHGYMETMNVYESFLSKHLKEQTVLIVDTPGHGNSEAVSPQQTMQQIAQQIIRLIDYLEIDRFAVYGHSMGGYVAQAIANEIPQRVLLLGLLHSNVFADSDEKKENRRREIELIRQGKLPLIAESFMPRVVAEFNYARLSKTISAWIDDVKTMNPEGVISCLHAMMTRPDNRHMLNGFTPIHLIGSDSDPFLSAEMIEIMRKGSAIHHFSIIEQCGHASFIEQPEELAKALAFLGE